MCQLTYANLGNDDLNRRAYLLMSAFGSTIHKHGWGFLSPDNDEFFKCGLPACVTVNAGDFIKEANGPIIGHIRYATAGVPVTDDNAHPFIAEDSKGKKVFQVHNGTLTPKDSKKFVTEYKVEVKDPATNVTTIETVKLSDSELFLSHVMDTWNESGGEFYLSVKKAMEDFTGKFALMYYVESENKTYIMTGKTAELHIAYRTKSEKPEAEIMGYVINTSKEVLDFSITLLTNLNLLSKTEKLFITSTSKLQAETIFLADGEKISQIGEIKENTASHSYTYYPAARSGTAYGGDYWESEEYNTPINYAPQTSITYAHIIYDFMEEYSMSLKDIQELFLKVYGASLLELEEPMLERFCKTVIPSLRNMANRRMKNLGKQKAVKRLFTHIYEDFEFPWMVNSKEDQERLCATLSRTLK